MSTTKPIKPIAEDIAAVETEHADRLSPAEKYRVAQARAGNYRVGDFVACRGSRYGRRYMKISAIREDGLVECEIGWFAPRKGVDPTRLSSASDPLDPFERFDLPAQIERRLSPEQWRALEQAGFPFGFVTALRNRGVDPTEPYRAPEPPSRAVVQWSARDVIEAIVQAQIDADEEPTTPPTPEQREPHKRWLAETYGDAPPQHLVDALLWEEEEPTPEQLALADRWLADHEEMIRGALTQRGNEIIHDHLDQKTRDVIRRAGAVK